MKKLTFLKLAVMLAVAAMTVNAGGIKHPSLLFTPAKVAAAKQRMAHDTVQTNGWKLIKEEADRQVKKGANVRKLEYPALAWLMTGDTAYANTVKRELLKTAEIKSWGDKEMTARKPAWRSELQMAHKAYQLALGYDAIYDRLSASERKKIANGLYRLAVEPLLGDWINEPTRIHALNSMGHNWWTSCAGMGGLLALALSNELPEAAKGAEAVVEALPQWFDFVGDVIQHKPRTFDRDGGMYESINYASFGITEALLFRQAWINSHPGAKLEEIPQMDKLASFFCNVAYPRNGMLYSINFGDSHKNVTGESSMILAYNQGAKDPATLWYINQIEPGQHREGFPRHFPMGFLYTPDLSNAPAEPALAKSHLWKDFGWATMRDSWDKDATMLAVKSGMTWNHSHADANSLIVFHNGTDIIKDAGNCSYGKPEYRNYFFQTDAHNVVKFNGEGQPTYQQYHGSMLPGSVSGLLDAGNIKYVLADGTGPMSHAFDRNFRSFLWIDDIIYMIDDIHSHTPGQFEWLWHPGGKAEKKGFDLNITNGESAASIRPIYPRPLAYSNFVHDYPEDMRWEVREGPTEDVKGTEEYYAFLLPGDTDRVKGLTAITLKDTPDQKEMPQFETREGKDWIGVRVIYKGKVTDLYINQLADGRLMHLNSWIDADGWTTDAYMLAVTYKEGADPTKPDEVFINHGSSLRRGNEVIFSSLAKLNVISKSEGKCMNLWVNGQPRINLKYKSALPALKVNGSNVNPQRQDGMVKISLKN